MKILIFAPSYFRSRFFYSLYEQLLKKEGYEVIFITIKYTAFKYLKSKHVDVVNIKDVKAAKLNEHQEEFFRNCIDEALSIDRKIGLLSEEQLKENYWYLVKRFVSVFLQYGENNNFFIFNGNAQYIEYTARLAGEYFHSNNVFFEIGNFPDKIFVDTKGVNAASSLMQQDLREHSCDMEEFLKFKKGYLSKKEQNHFVPQSKFKPNKIYKILDHDRFEPSIFVRLINMIRNLKKRNAIEFDNLPNRRFLFFPLQVSYDSQVLRFSNVDLFQAIDVASTDAQKNDFAFVVKPHPAETNLKIIEYAKNKGAYIVDTNTYELLKKAAKIYTINSTVGLESFFYDKNLVVLGDAFYKKYAIDSYDNKLKVLCNYLYNILIDGSYFDEKRKISKKLLDYLESKEKKA